MKLFKLKEILILMWLTIAFLQSCTSKHEKDHAATKKPVREKKQGASINNKLFVEGDSLVIIVNKQQVKIFRDSGINYQNPYEGIYIIDKDTIVRRFSVLKGSFLYFTIYEDLGMGYRAYLFVYDMNKKVLIKNPSRKVNNIFSSTAVFFIEDTRVISVNRPTWNDKLGTWNTKAGIYRITGDKFVFEKEVEEPGEKLMDDVSTVIDFHHKVLMTR